MLVRIFEASHFGATMKVNYVDDFISPVALGLLTSYLNVTVLLISTIHVPVVKSFVVILLSVKVYASVSCVMKLGKDGDQLKVRSSG